MGDRFYMQQKNTKGTRVLKKDVIKDLENLLNSKVDGVDRMTIPHIQNLTKLIEDKLLS